MSSQILNFQIGDMKLYMTALHMNVMNINIGKMIMNIIAIVLFSSDIRVLNLHAP